MATAGMRSVQAEFFHLDGNEHVDAHGEGLLPLAQDMNKPHSQYGIN